MSRPAVDRLGELGGGRAGVRASVRPMKRGLTGAGAHDAGERLGSGRAARGAARRVDSSSARLAPSRRRRGNIAT